MCYDARTSNTRFHESGKPMVRLQRGKYVPADGPLDVTQISRAEYDDPASHDHDPHGMQYLQRPEEDEWLGESFPPKNAQQQQSNYPSEDEEDVVEDDGEDDNNMVGYADEHERHDNDLTSPQDVGRRRRRCSYGGSGSRSARRRESELERLREVYGSGVDPSESHVREDLVSRRRMNDMREEAAMRHVYGSGNGSLSSRRREAIKKDEAIRLAYGGGSASARKAPKGLLRSNSFNGRWG